MRGRGHRGGPVPLPAAGTPRTVSKAGRELRLDDMPACRPGTRRQTLLFWNWRSPCTGHALLLCAKPRVVAFSKVKNRDGGSGTAHRPSHATMCRCGQGGHVNHGCMQDCSSASRQAGKAWPWVRMECHPGRSSTRSQDTPDGGLCIEPVPSPRRSHDGLAAVRKGRASLAAGVLAGEGAPASLADGLVGRLGARLLRVPLGSRPAAARHGAPLVKGGAGAAARLLARPLRPRA